MGCGASSSAEMHELDNEYVSDGREIQDSIIESKQKGNGWESKNENINKQSKRESLNESRATNLSGQVRVSRTNSTSNIVQSNRSKEARAAKHSSKRRGSTAGMDVDSQGLGPSSITNAFLSLGSRKSLVAIYIINAFFLDNDIF